MSRIAKLAFILAIAAIMIGATQLVSRGTRELGGASSMQRAQISPEELTRAEGLLPQSKFQSYEWVYPLP
jgi:hypothetical protein